MVTRELPNGDVSSSNGDVSSSNGDVSATFSIPNDFPEVTCRQMCGWCGSSAKFGTELGENGPEIVQMVMILEPSDLHF